MYVSGELLLAPDADLRPGLRAYVLCDTTLVGAPMVTAAEWSTAEVTDPAPRVAGRRVSREIALKEWLLPKGRHYLTVAGPHARSAGSFVALTLRALPRQVREPIYTFAFISDTHVYARKERLDWMNRKMGDATADEFRRTLDALAEESIAFVLHGGDMTETALRSEFEEIAGIIGGRSFPVYGCLGNHDVYLDSSRPDALDVLGAHFPDGALDYTFTHAPVRFVVMDVAIEQPELEAARQEWLRRTLDADRRVPTVFTWHYAPYNRAGVAASGFRMPDWSALGRRTILDLLQRAPNVVATLNGHDHWDEVNYLGGVTHVQNAAFVEWPNTYRVLRVYPDRLEWEVRQVANRGFVRESFLPDKHLSWMIATRETDLTGEAPLRRLR
jgi:predicted phosphodiesterase